MAARFWIGGTGNWNDTTHWSTTSGGTGGAAVPTSVDDVTFDSNSGTSATVSINVAANANSITINKSDLTLVDNTGLTVVAAVTLTTGTFNTNGQTESWGSLAASGSSARTLTLGASNITVTGTSGTPWNISTATSMTLNANTSTITLSGNGTRTFQSGGLTYNNVVLNGTGTVSFIGGSTLTNLTRTGGTVKTDVLQLGSNITITTTLTLTGNSLTNRLLVSSNVLGSSRTITSAAVSITNVDFRDVTGAGLPANASWTGSSLGDAGGNSNITFTSQVTRYWVATSGGSWSQISSWSTSSGGASGASVPLCHDIVVFDSNSIASTGQVITQDMFRIPSIDFTNVKNSPTLSIGTSTEVYGGGIIFNPSMKTSGNNVLTFLNRSSASLTTNGVIMNCQIRFSNVGTTFTLNDNVICTLAMQQNNGTLTINGNVTCTTFTSTTNTRTINMGSGTFTLTGTGTVWNLASASMTFNAQSSTIVIADTSSTNKTFTGGGLVYNNIYLNQGGSGLVIFSDGNTYTNFTIETPKSVQFQSTTTNTIQNFNAIGSASRLATITASTPGSAATLASTGATWECDYLSLKDSAGTGNTKYAGANSTNVSGNSGWIFTAPPTRSSGAAPQPNIRGDILTF